MTTRKLNSSDFAPKNNSKGTKINGHANQNQFDVQGLKQAINQEHKKQKLEVREVLNKLLELIEPVDFEKIAFPQLEGLKNRLAELDSNEPEYKSVSAQIRKCKLTTKHYTITLIEELSKTAIKHDFGLAEYHQYVYVYTGTHWEKIDSNDFKSFLRDVALKMGIEKFNAKYHRNTEEYLKQFFSNNHLPKTSINLNQVSINLNNGTYDITANEKILRPFNKADFLTYVLNFDFDPNAEAPLFEKYLDRVLPQQELQNVLAEYIGSLFIRNGNDTLKLEKVLVLYGSGANGKSVLFEILMKLFGKDNVTSYTLEKLTDSNGYSRAQIENKILNYAPEISTRLDQTLFKQISSGEPIEARSPYKEPFIMENYAKIICNCNELPKDIEHNEGFFRRFMIIPFNVTIPVEEQDKNLHTKIVTTELSGIFNWVLSGLDRLLKNGKFTQSDIIDNIINEYKIESDSVALFIEDGFIKSTNNGSYSLRDIYQLYRDYSLQNGYKPLNLKNFRKRLEFLKVEVIRRSEGTRVFLESNMNNI